MSVTLSNITLIGAPDSDTSDVGMLFRRGTGATIYNAVIVGFKAACIDVDGEETFDLAETNLTIENSVFACNKTFKVDDEKDDNEETIEDPIDLEAYFLDPALNNMRRTLKTWKMPSTSSPRTSASRVL